MLAEGHMRPLVLLLLLLSYTEDASLLSPAGYTEQEQRDIIKGINENPQTLDYFSVFSNADDFIYMHTPDMLSRLNHKAWIYFANYFAALSRSDQITISRSITQDDILALDAASLCNRLTIFIPSMLPSRIALIEDECAAQIFRYYARRKEYSEKSLSASGSGMDNWAEGLRQMQYVNNSHWDAQTLNLWLSSKPTDTNSLDLAIIHSLSEDDCHAIEAPFLLFLSKSQLLALSAECFANVSGWHKLTVLSEVHRQKLGSLTPHHFSRMHAEVSDAFAGALTGQQLALYNEVGCSCLPVHSIQVSALSKITSGCLQKYLLHFSFPGKTSLLPPLVWSAIPLPTISGITDTEMLLRLSPKDWLTFPFQSLQTLISVHPDLCAWNLSIDTHQAALSPDCIVAFHSSVLQIAYLERLGPNLPSTHYAYFPADMFDKWPNKLVHLLGFDLGAVHWQYLGDNFRGNEHPCALIREPSALLKLRPLQANMSRACFDSIACWSDFGSADIDKLHEHTFGMLSIQHLQNSGLEPVLRTMSSSRMKMLSKNSRDFCKELTTEHWSLLSADAIKGIHPSCIPSLQFLAKLKNDQVSALPDDAFSLTDSSTLNEIRHLVPSMRPEQLASLGLHVPLEHSPGQAFTDATLQALPVSLLSSLNDPTIRAFNPAAIAQISSSHNLSLLPAASLIHLTADHIRHIPKTAFAGLTLMQASMIGKALDLDDLVDEEISPLVFLTSKKAILECVSRKAWEELRRRLEIAQEEYHSIMQEKVLITADGSGNGGMASSTNESGGISGRIRASPPLAALLLGLYMLAM